MEMNNSKKFISNKQTRFENDIQTATATDVREITIEGWNDNYPPSSNIVISVSPSMKPKLATLKGMVATISVYLCEDDKDYSFEIWGWPEIEKVIVKRISLSFNLKIVYE